MIILASLCNEVEFSQLCLDNENRYDRAVRLTKLNDFEGLGEADDYILLLSPGDKCSSKPGELVEAGYLINFVSETGEGEPVLCLFKISGGWRYEFDTWLGNYAEMLHSVTVKRNDLGSRPISRTESLLACASREYTLKRLSLAKARYLERTKLGGWAEEIYHALYRLTKIALKTGEIEEAVTFTEAAYAFRPTRNEALIKMTQHFRCQPNQQSRAYQFLSRAMANKSTKDIFKVRRGCYNADVFYEKSILDYYVHRDQKSLGLRACVDFVNVSPRERLGLVFSNIEHYYECLKADWKRLTFSGLEEKFVSSSIAVDSNKNSVIRTVDYFITPSGDYNLADGKTVNTINYRAVWDNESREFSELTRLPDPPLPKNADYIRGIEDVRLNGGIITATTREYSYLANHQNRILFGNIDEPLTWTIVKPPSETQCEKNWIPISDQLVIYSWYPYRIGKVIGDQLVIVATQPTPNIFSQFRGSSCPMKIGDSYYTLVHLVHERRPRLYVHAWVRFDSVFRVTGFSLPFRFKGDYTIEYCLSAQSFNGKEIEIFMSAMDRESWHGRIDSKLCTENIIPL